MNIKGEKFKIMVGGQVIGTAKLGQLIHLHTVEKAEEPKHEEFNKSWDISCNALVSEGDIPNPLKDMMQGPQLVNVKIERPIGKMPRKMKKADKRDPFCKTKWGRKAWNYRRKHSTIINDAEIVVTKQDQETLTATITKAMEQDAPCARVSGEDIMKAMEKYSDIRIALRRRQGNRVFDCHDCPHWQDGDDNVTCEYPDCPPCAEHEI